MISCEEKEGEEESNEPLKIFNLIGQKKCIDDKDNVRIIVSMERCDKKCFVICKFVIQMSMPLISTIRIVSIDGLEFAERADVLLTLSKTSASFWRHT